PRRDGCASHAEAFAPTSTSVGSVRPAARSRPAFGRSGRRRRRLRERLRPRRRDQLRFAERLRFGELSLDHRPARGLVLVIEPPFDALLKPVEQLVDEGRLVGAGVRCDAKRGALLLAGAGPRRVERALEKPRLEDYLRLREASPAG